MPRPKSEDPKQPLTIRIPASVLAKIGDDARGVVEALVCARYGEPAASRLDAPRATARVHVDVPTFERKAFNPRPKTGKR